MIWICQLAVRQDCYCDGEIALEYEQNQLDAEPGLESKLLIGVIMTGGRT